MTAIYLAAIADGEQVEALASFNDPDRKPNVLISFHYLKNFKKGGGVERLISRGHRLMLDSGAYSAWTLGKKIDMDKLCEEAKTGRWDEVVALDEIGNAEVSATNAKEMKKKGLDVMPVFHFGDPWEVLTEYKTNFNKVGLSCCLGEAPSESIQWVEECFSRAYPYKFHSFGWIKEDVLMRFPFHSGDSSSWVLSAHGFGRWKFANGQHLGLSRKAGRDAAGKTNLKPEVEWYLKLQDRLRARWKNEFAKNNWRIECKKEAISENK